MHGTETARHTAYNAAQRGVASYGVPLRHRRAGSRGGYPGSCRNRVGSYQLPISDRARRRRRADLRRNAARAHITM
eukprot:SAG31_NODE_17600_length_665_cov_0.653710_1_plen_75_part_01